MLRCQCSNRGQKGLVGYVNLRTIAGAWSAWRFRVAVVAARNDRSSSTTDHALRFCREPVPAPIPWSPRAAWD